MGVEEKLQNSQIRELREYSLDHLDEIKEFDSSKYNIMDITLGSFNLQTPSTKDVEYNNAYLVRVKPLIDLLNIYRDVPIGDMVLGEGVSNSLEHGNKQDPLKKATIYFREIEEGLEILIEDEDTEHTQKFRSWISSSNKIVDASNPAKCYHDENGPCLESDYSSGGRGLSMMLGFFDDVGYYQSPNGGTITRLFLSKGDFYHQSKIHYILGELKNTFQDTPNSTIGELVKQTIESEEESA